VKELGLKVPVPGNGKAVAVELTPKDAGVFTVSCSEYCGRGHGRMLCQLVVTAPLPPAAESSAGN
jgi:heme/copper-type cytochrome/quinol oxidase subunit 2